MPVKDRVVSWWIQNVIIPHREIIDKPGFVVTTYTEGIKTIYLRDFFLPELLFELIENKIVERYDNQGKQILYSVGKKFGYLFASVSNFPTIKNISLEKLSNFAYLTLRYIEGTYAQKANHELDFEKKILSIFFDNYIICRHNGLCYIMMDGAISGLWAYEIQDKSVEGIQFECQGRGNEQCHFFSAPRTILQEKTSSFFCEDALPDYKTDDHYKALNEIRETNYVKNSLKNLLDAGFFDFKKGILSYKNNRFFHCDTNLLYLLDDEIVKLPDGEQILYNASFEYGRLLQESYGGTNYKKFIPDFFSALGFGDILVIDTDKLSIAFIYYPWTIFSKQSKYIILRGIMSGIVSSSIGKNIQFNNVTVDIGKYLTVKISI